MKLRGEAIHTHLYIPCPVAEAALYLVLLAAEEFETNWLEHFHPDAVQVAKDQMVECPRLVQTVQGSAIGLPSPEAA